MFVHLDLVERGMFNLMLPFFGINEWPSIQSNVIESIATIIQHDDQIVQRAACIDGSGLATIVAIIEFSTE